jgi:hypothetical protein
VRQAGHHVAKQVKGLYKNAWDVTGWSCEIAAWMRQIGHKASLNRSEQVCHDGNPGRPTLELMSNSLGIT